MPFLTGTLGSPRNRVYIPDYGFADKPRPDLEPSPSSSGATGGPSPSTPSASLRTVSRRTAPPSLPPALSSLLDLSAPVPSPLVTSPAVEKKTVGSPSLDELVRSLHEGTLDVNRRGMVTTPGVRRALRNLRTTRSRLEDTTGLTGPLQPGQQTFAEQVARETGLSPRVVGAQTLAEESAGAAAARQAEGNHNWLNIGYFDSGPGELTQDSTWGNPHSAAKATSEFFKGERFGPSAGIRAILPSSADASDAAQISAIANSGWATSPTYQTSLEGTYDLIGQRRNPRAQTAHRRAVQAARELGLNPGAGGKPQTRFELVGGPHGVVSAVDKFGARTLDRFFDYGGGNTGNPENVANLNPVFAGHLIQLAKAADEPIDVNSAYRTEQEQGEISPGTNPAAPAGYSAHQFGMALDSDFTQRQAELAPRFGLEHGAAGPGVADPPHTELTDPALIRRAARFGPIRSGYAPAGVELAVGDLGDYQGGGMAPGVSSVGSTAASLIAAGAPAGLVGQAVAQAQAPPVIPISQIQAPLAPEVPLPESFLESPSTGAPTSEQDDTALLDLLSSSYGLMPLLGARRSRRGRG